MLQGRLVVVSLGSLISPERRPSEHFLSRALGWGSVMLAILGQTLVLLVQ
jgi:hypothetical protein